MLFFRFSVVIQGVRSSNKSPACSNQKEITPSFSSVTSCRKLFILLMLSYPSSILSSVSSILVLVYWLPTWGYGSSFFHFSISRRLGMRGGGGVGCRRCNRPEVCLVQNRVETFSLATIICVIIIYQQSSDTWYRCTSTSE